MLFGDNAVISGLSKLQYMAPIAIVEDSIVFALPPLLLLHDL